MREGPRVENRKETQGVQEGRGKETGRKREGIQGVREGPRVENRKETGRHSGRPGRAAGRKQEGNGKKSMGVREGSWEAAGRKREENRKKTTIMQVAPREGIRVRKQSFLILPL